jgi:hypothetical protein
VTVLATNSEDRDRGKFSMSDLLVLQCDKTKGRGT